MCVTFGRVVVVVGGGGGGGVVVGGGGGWPFASSLNQSMLVSECLFLHRSLPFFASIFYFWKLSVKKHAHLKKNYYLHPLLHAVMFS